jgi:ubiquinone/menaquinone biosynthesis C-methylase UbiE
MASIDPEGAETRAIDRLVDLRSRSVIEIGAGDGRLTRRLAARAGSVVALDPNASQIRKARSSLPTELKDRVRFVVTDATTYRFPRERYDVAVLAHSL